jgi:hypothetical protein
MEKYKVKLVRNRELEFSSCLSTHLFVEVDAKSASEAEGIINDLIGEAESQGELTNNSYIREVLKNNSINIISDDEVDLSDDYEFSVPDTDMYNHDHEDFRTRVYKANEVS